MLFHTESLEAAGSWLPGAAAAVLEFEADEAATTAAAAATTATSTLLFLKALFPPDEAVPRCEVEDCFLDLIDLN